MGTLRGGFPEKMQGEVKTILWESVAESEGKMDVQSSTLCSVELYLGLERK